LKMPKGYSKTEIEGQTIHKGQKKKGKQ